MNNSKLLKKLAFCLVLAGNCYAVDTSSPTIAVDPTLVFFTSLSTCTPGEYSEQNDLTSHVGQSYLKQQIIGMENGICNVKLTTPDNRSMTCAIPMQQMSAFTDQHFLQGIIQSADNIDQDGINAEELWSKVKTNYCNFDAQE